MANFLFMILADRKQVARGLEAFQLAHALKASMMAEEVELLFFGAGVEWPLQSEEGPEHRLNPEAGAALAALTLAQEAGVKMRICTRACHERGLIDRLEAHPELLPTGAPTYLAARAGEGWTVMNF